MCRKFGAPEESRTPDPRLKRALLYQLSYRRILNCPVCTVSPLILRPLVTPFRHKTRSSYSDFIPPNKIAVHVFIMVEREGNDPSSCGFSDRRSDLISYRSVKEGNRNTTSLASIYTWYMKYGGGSRTRTHKPLITANSFQDCSPHLLGSIPPYLVGRVGLEPTAFLMSRFYRPLPSPIWIPTDFYLN